MHSPTSLQKESIAGAEDKLSPRTVQAAPQNFDAVVTINGISELCFLLVLLYDKSILSVIPLDLFLLDGRRRSRFNN